MFIQQRIETVLPGTSERRHADRFPIEREVKYRILNKKYAHENGSGRTVNVSSSGVLFETENLLLPGRKIELSMSWPAQLDNRCALKLVARGKIVRCEHGRAALSIDQYEFRTQAKPMVE